METRANGSAAASPATSATGVGGATDVGSAAGVTGAGGAIGVGSSGGAMGVTGVGGATGMGSVGGATGMGSAGDAMGVGSATGMGGAIGLGRVGDATGMGSAGWAEASLAESAQSEARAGVAGAGVAGRPVAGVPEAGRFEDGWDAAGVSRASGTYTSGDVAAGSPADGGAAGGGPVGGDPTDGGPGGGEAAGGGPRGGDAAGGTWAYDPWGRSHRGFRRRPGRGFGLAILVGLIQVVGTQAAGGEQHHAAALTAWAYFLLLAGPVALVVRRQAPVVALAVSLAATVAYTLSNYPGGPTFLAVVVAFFATVRAGRRRATWMLAGAAYLVYVGLGHALDLLGGPFDLFGGLSVHKPTLGDSVAVGAWLLVVLALAEAVRVRTEHFAELSRFRAEQARARGEQQRRQASEERLRMARELHDVLGHHLSLINVQAGVGLHLMDAQPEQARAALTAIKSASAEALREVRSVLGVLRPQEEVAPRAPAPGVDAVGDLTAEAGFAVHTEVLGERRALPAEVDRAAYRIVQEALTNVRRHAGAGATATVLLEYGERELTVRVDDNGRGAAAGSDGATGTPDRVETGAGDPDGGGNGIVGMRERVAALGGELTAGSRPEGGFRVHARLPLATPPVAPPPGVAPPLHVATAPPPTVTPPLHVATGPPPAATMPLHVATGPPPAATMPLHAAAMPPPAAAAPVAGSAAGSRHDAGEADG